MLVNALENDPDFKVRIAAAQALAKIADGTVADWMLRAFRNDDSEAVRLTILFSIAEIPDGRIIPPLVELAHQEILSGKERILVEQILWNYREAFHTPAWINSALTSKNHEMRRISVWMLGIVAHSDMVPLFEKLASDPSEEIQIESVGSLAKSGTQQALDLCRAKMQQDLSLRLKRATSHCIQANEVALRNQGEVPFRKKMSVAMNEVARKHVTPAHYAAYLNKNVNERQVDVATSFLQPLRAAPENRKSTKLIEMEKIRTFHLAVDLESKYEFDSGDLEILKSIVRENSGSLDICYVRELRQTPNLQGRVKTFFKIVQSGALTEVKIIESTLKNVPVESCILQELATFTFPRLPINSVNLIYSFSFVPPDRSTIVF